MVKCEHCERFITNQAHVLNKRFFCSKDCAIIHLAEELIATAKETAAKRYESTATIMPIGDYDMCAACDADLGACETIWAAEGILYCSRECGIEDFKVEYGDDAERHFDEVAEEINPQDIGLKRRN